MSDNKITTGIKGYDQIKYDRINVLTYNIQTGCNHSSIGRLVTGWWKYFLPHDVFDISCEIGESIVPKNIALATFTEMEFGSLRTKGQDQSKIIASASGLINIQTYPLLNMRLPKAIGRMPTSDYTNQGNAIISSHEIIESETYELVGAGEKRALCMARIGLKDSVLQSIDTYVTHLSVGKKDRLKQIDQICELMSGNDNPIILTGDFNTEDKRQLNKIRDKCGLSDAGYIKSWPTWHRQSRALDHIFYSEEFNVSRTYIDLDLKASDHYPLIAELKFKGRENKK